MNIIKSEKEKKNTLKWLEKVKKNLQELPFEVIKEENVRKTMEINYKSMIIQFENQLKEYEELKNGTFQLPEELTYKELLENMVKLRISKNISQSELARLLNIPRQQVHRYEEQAYQNISINKVDQILKVLGINLKIKIGKTA